jgi:flagellar biosynthesis/type III secretory pathway chaperone
MASAEEFDSKFDEIISQEDFDEPSFQTIALNEVSETLASITFACAQLSNLMNELIKASDVEITAAFLELLNNVKEVSEKFNDDIQIDIIFNDSYDDDLDEENEDDEDEELEEDQGEEE